MLQALLLRPSAVFEGTIEDYNGLAEVLTHLDKISVRHIGESDIFEIDTDSVNEAREILRLLNDFYQRNNKGKVPELTFDFYF